MTPQKNPPCMIGRKTAGRHYNLIVAVAIVIIAGIFLLHWQERRAFRAELNSLHISKREANFINAELNKRNAGDCTVTREWYGFRCVEKSGKVFRVYL
jgi:hypothetical protein